MMARLVRGRSRRAGEVYLCCCQICGAPIFGLRPDGTSDRRIVQDAAFKPFAIENQRWTCKTKAHKRAYYRYIRGLDNDFDVRKL